MMSMDDTYSRRKSPSGRSSSRQRAALRKMEEGVKKHVAQAVVRRSDSMLTRDEDATLLTEIDMARASSTQSESDSSASGTAYSTWGSDTMTNNNTVEDDTIENSDENVHIRGKYSAAVPPQTASPRVLEENMNVTNNKAPVLSPVVGAGMIPMPGAYKQTVRSKFDYYRKQQAFNRTGDSFAPSPVAPTPIATPMSANTPVSGRPTLTLQTLHGSECGTPKVEPSPSARRNELAKQIIQRRQNQATTPSRSGVDP